MTPKKHFLRAPSAYAPSEGATLGLFATLFSAFFATGIGAPNAIAPRPPSCGRRPRPASLLALSIFLALLGAAMLAPAPALAAAPETPELTVEHVWASTAVFNGTLSPKGLVPAEGTYKFLYRASKTQCKGGSETAPGMALGGAPEVLPAEQVNGLTPSTEYAVCLSLTNLSAETATSPPVTFKTTAAAKPEAPEATEASERKATTATLNGVVNPLKEGEPGHYRFVYRQSASECTGAGAVETVEEPASGASPQGVSVSITGLQAGKPYTYCVRAINALGESTLSAPETFTSAIPPEAPEEEAREVTPSSAKLTAVLSPNAIGDPGTYEIFFQQVHAACEGGGETLVGSGAVTGAQGQAVEAAVENLTPHSTYEFCVRLVNQVGETVVGAPLAFTTTALAPVVDGEGAEQVAATGAQLHVRVSPNGSQTSVRFEYGPSAGYGSTVTVEAGAGQGDTDVSSELQGLSPASLYHWRAIVKSAAATVTGPDHVFTTQGAPSAGLIDGRQWEMVSPPDKHGAPLEMPGQEGGLVQASADGAKLTYFASSPATAELSGSRSFADSQLLSSRTASGVWETQDITPSNESVEGLKSFRESEYTKFSTDLSDALAEPQGGTPECAHPTTECPEHTEYLRHATGEYQPLLPATGLRAGVKYGGHEPTPGQSFLEGVEFAGASPDLSHVVLRSFLALTGDFKAGFEKGEESLYEWSGGALQLVSILPDKHPAAEEELKSTFGDMRNSGDVRNAVSTDGQRVVFQAKAGENPQAAGQGLYLRDVRLGKTVKLDVVQPGVTEPEKAEPVFLDATGDDSRVFFRDSQRLTAVSGEGDLYMCEIVESEGELSCALKDLTVPASPAESTGVAGIDLGVDESGTVIYFVAGAALAPGAQAGEPNLYVEDTTTGARRLVAVLSGGDRPDWAEVENGKGPEGAQEFTARVSTDGRYLAFMSERSLTGYDNEDVTSRSPGERMDEEVFLYHAPAGEDLTSEPGTLTCVSCNPDGARPRGVFDPGFTYGAAHGEKSLLVDQSDIWEVRWLAGSLPILPSTRAGSPTVSYLPRNLDDSGRLFFDSADALVPGDTNGKEDVYEYEPQGTGGCALPSGCVGLVSSGASSGESAFVDASGMGPGGEEGEDVFFMTAAKLVSQDQDAALDIYDAHVCSSASPCASHAVDVSPGCTTSDSCRGAPAPQPAVFGAPASATFSGPGNPAPPPPPSVKGKTAAQIRAENLAKALKACHKDKKKSKRSRCEKTAHKKYGATAKAKRASHNRRPSR